MNKTISILSLPDMEWPPKNNSNLFDLGNDMYDIIIGRILDPSDTIKVNRYLASKFDTCIEYIYSDPSFEYSGIFLAHMWNIFLFFFDDKMDENPDIKNNPMTARLYLDTAYNCLEHQKLPENSLYKSDTCLYNLSWFIYIFIKDVFKLLDEYSSLWFPRFLKNVYDYFYIGCLNAVDSWSTNSVGPVGSVDLVKFYVKYRKHDSGVLTCIDLIEVGMGIHISNDVYYSKTIKRLRNLCAKIVALTNDILSFDKEVRHKNPNNLVIVVYSSHKNFDFDSDLKNDPILEISFDFCLNYIHDLIFSFSEICKSSHSSEFNDINLYIQGMKNWIQGSLYWHLQSGRYLYEGSICSHYMTKLSQNKSRY